MKLILQFLFVIFAVLVCVQGRSLENDVLDQLFKGVGKEDKFSGECTAQVEFCAISHALRTEQQI